jgi:dihydroorotate dehydrogenase (NAD+) catalytic subunit
MNAPIDLSVAIGSLRLSNPVMNASGTMGYGHEAPTLTRAAGLGAIVSKTFTLAPRAGNPPPRLCETPSGLLNSIGLQNVGVERFLREQVDRLARLGPPLIVSVGGESVDEFTRCIARLESAPIAAYEINISCPNVAAGGLQFACAPESAAAVIRAVRRETSRPIIAKLTPNVTDIVSIGRACRDAGADALTSANTYLGMVVDVERSRPVLRRVVGGVSGPAIRPLALARVYQLAQALDAPIIGSGGIVTARDAMEFLLAGASAVQVGSALLRDAGRAATLTEGLREFLRRRGDASLANVIGALRVPNAARRRMDSRTGGRA